MKVSLVMAVYNGEKYLIEQLDSIRKQTYPIDEVILIDDVSTDNSYELIHQYIDGYKLINWKLIKNENNLGYRKNFKKGLEIVDGDIIEIDIPARTINVRLTDEELVARPMTPVTRDRYVPKSLKAYASMVSSADKGAVRIID